MSATQLDIEMEQGATFELNLIYKDPLGQPENLTNYTASMQIRKVHGGPVLISADSASGRILLGSGGQVSIHIPHTATARVTQNAIYDLFIQSPGGEIARRLIYGSVTLMPSVTRSA